MINNNRNLGFFFLFLYLIEVIFSHAKFNYANWFIKLLKLKSGKIIFNVIDKL